MTTSLDAVTLEVIWTRLISVVDEAAKAIVRTSFSTLSNEANDFACVLTDSRGFALAQNSGSIPSFIGCLPATVRHFLHAFGRDGFRGGEGRLLWPGEQPSVSEATANIVDQEVGRLVNEAHDRAAEILRERRDLLEKLAKVLIVQEVIDGKDLHDYVEGRKPIPTQEEVEAARDQAPTEQISGPEIIGSPSDFSIE